MNTANVTITFQNRAALDALCEAVDLVKEAADDSPWNDDLAEAVDLLRQAARGLTVNVERSPAVEDFGNVLVEVSYKAGVLMGIIDPAALAAHFIELANDPQAVRRATEGIFRGVLVEINRRLAAGNN